MQKIKSKFEQVKSYYKIHPKRFWVVGAVLIITIFVMITKKPATNSTIVAVEKVDLKQTVLATGQVTSLTDLSLSFPVSGLVGTLPVKTGDIVKRGQVLVTLQNQNEYANLKSAQAKYKKIVEGASNEEIAVAQAQLDSAKSALTTTISAQDTLVANARRAYLNNDLTPVLFSGTGSTTPTITGIYAGDSEGTYLLTPYVSGAGGFFSFSGIESGTVSINTSAPIPLGTKGLYIQFPTSTTSTGDSWTIALPNKNSSTFVSAYNAYQNALQTRDSSVSSAEALVKEREASLLLKKAQARPSELDSAEADVISAQATYEKTILRAPADGTVVHVDTKIGERVDMQNEVVTIQDVGNLYVEANINETNIAKVVLGQQVIMTLDAFGQSTVFSGEVIHIDPSSTTNDGVANYKIKVSINDAKLHNVRPGMNANMTIIAWTRPQVVAVPKAGITENEKGASMVKVIAGDDVRKFEVREVTVGQLGDGNMIEIISGLNAGEKILIGSVAK